LLLRILLWRVLLLRILLPERSRFQASRECYDCHPITFHFSLLLGALSEQLER